MESGGAAPIDETRPVPTSYPAAGGNHLARIVVPGKTDRFEVNVDLVADLATYSPFDYFLEDSAQQWPFEYAEESARDLEPYLVCLPATPTFEAFFATGPTELVKKPGDHLSAYYLLDASFEDGSGPSADRFTLSDGRPALRRTIAELQAWNPSVERFNSEIEGPIWTTGGSADQLSGAISTDSDAEPERSTTVRAGLFCID